jgi:amyloid beta A4 protein
MKVKSFAMLLPCGIDVFSGVEFVCCPSSKAASTTKKERLDKKPLTSSWPKELKLQEIEEPNKLGKFSDSDDDYDSDDDDDYFEYDDEDDDYDEEDDEYDDDYYDEEIYENNEEEGTTTKSTTTTTTTTTPTTTTTTTTTTTEKPTADPYFTHYDPREEHEAYKKAERRFEEHHRAKVSKVMKDWSDLEEKYQEMREKDPASAEDFKKKMTERFQKTVQALEEESQAEKRQLQAMHQQRVISMINQKKKMSMSCYTKALNENTPNTHRVQKCLQKLLRALHKDRHHTIQHFRHLLETSLDQAERERDITVEHLADIDRLVNESLQMLSRFQDLNTKILPLMEDYLIALRSRDNTPASLLRMDKQHEEEMINNYTSDIKAKIQERERERIEEKKQRVASEKKSDKPTKDSNKIELVSASDSEGESTTKAAAPAPVAAGPDGAPVEPAKELKIEVHATAVHHEKLEPIVAHAQSHEISHNQAGFSVRQVELKRESSSVYVTLGFAGIAMVAAMLVGVVVLKRRNGRHPHHQGFVEVDQTASPEERHVANMQMNGYENPTYKYFEATCT